MEFRLDKFLSEQKNLSRADSRKLIQRGKVTVDKHIVRSADFKINPEINLVELLGVKVPYKEHIYIMLNKPAGILSAASDKSRKTVVDLLPDELMRKGLFPVGRLDRDTTGFIIITDDGDFAHYVISPKSGIKKKYRVLLDGELTESAADELRRGITLADGTKCLPAEVKINPDNPHEAEVEISEGKYHHIKRSFGVIGLGVNELHRKSIGGVYLDENLPAGGCRELSAAELDKIYKKIQ